MTSLAEQVLADATKHTTLYDVVVSTRQFEKEKQHGNRFESIKGGGVTFTGLKLTPFIGTKMLMIEAEAKGTKTYFPSINAFGMEFQEEKDQDHNIQIALKGKQYWMGPIQGRTGLVDVRCTCHDFIFVWAFPHKQQKSLARGGQLKLYTKKTDRAPINPKQHAGACKHLLGLIQQLGQANIILPAVV